MGFINREMILVFLLVLCLCRKIEGYYLEVGFYGRWCPHAELIVTEEVRNALLGDQGLAAGLVRMHFHDAFVRGADGSVLIDSTPDNTAEKDSPANNPSLRGFEVIDSAKARLEAECEGIVSCADIIAFAARDSIFFSKGLNYPVPSGRRDGRVSLASEASANIPSPSSNLSQLTQAFARKGLTQEEMITLSGAHTIGRSHCNSFSNRLYNFSSTTSQDPSLDPTYAARLKQQCPNGNDLATLVVSMDPFTPTIFDNNHYNLILANRGLFTSDQTLLSTPAAAAQVQLNANNGLFFMQNFVRAMVKMGQIEVLTGTQGEIRSNCRKIN